MYDYGTDHYFPLKLNSERKMQLTNITHLEFMLEARLQLVDHIQIVYQNDKVLYIYDDN